MPKSFKNIGKFIFRFIIVTIFFSYLIKETNLICQFET